VQGGLTGGSGLQRKDDVVEVSFLARRPSNVLNFQLDKQLLQHLRQRKVGNLGWHFAGLWLMAFAFNWNRFGVNVIMGCYD